MSAIGTLTQGAAYAGLRTALTLPALAGLGVSREGARSIGRVFGASGINRKRVDRAAERLSVALPAMGFEDRGREARRDLVLRSYEHLAMLAVEMSVLPRMLTADGWLNHVEVGPIRSVISAIADDRPTILITGHCGNWEVMGASMAAVGCPMYALYRPLDLKPLDEWVRRTRQGRGLTLLDKFGAAQKLPGLMRQKASVGFVADQNAGDKGLFVPFMGRLASAYKTIGLFAAEHRANVVCGHAWRLGWDNEGVARGTRRVGSDRLKYRLEVSDAFTAEDYLDQPDPVYYITARYRRAIERMVRQAPEQYLWMHRIWKSRPRHERSDKPFPESLRRKLLDLPWMDEGAVDGLVERSDRDRAFLTANGLQRMP